MIILILAKLIKAASVHHHCSWGVTAELLVSLVDESESVPAAGLGQTVVARLAAVTLLSGHSWFTRTHSSVVTLERLGACEHTIRTLTFNHVQTVCSH